MVRRPATESRTRLCAHSTQDRRASRGASAGTTGRGFHIKTEDSAINCSKLLRSTLAFTAALAFVGFAPTDAAAEDDGFHVGGALRYNIFYKTFDDANDDTFGEIAYDVFRLNVDGQTGDIGLSAEYRLYQGYHMLHHGYMSYNFNDNTELQFGVSQVPFGILPYASHNWFFQLPYYVGLEDDYDLGFKVLYTNGPMDLQFALYKNDEGAYTGGTSSARYSLDVVPATISSLPGGGVFSDEEHNQLNVRAAYNLNTTEIGVSGMFGQLYNTASGDMGTRYAAALHVDGTYGPVNVKIEGLTYAFDPSRVLSEDADPYRDYVAMGAYNAPYLVADNGTMALAGISYSLPVDMGPISNLTFYENYTYFMKGPDGFDPSHSNVLGCMVTAGSVYTYVDVATGKNHPWLGGPWTTGLAEGGGDSWETRVNINVGYYF